MLLQPDPENQPYQFQVGHTIKITGLRKCPELNKAQGIIQDFDPLMCRWLVAIGATRVWDDPTEAQLQLVWVRPAHIVLQNKARCEAQQADTIEIL